MSWSFGCGGWPCGCGGGATAYHAGGEDRFIATLYATADKTPFSTDTTTAVTTANLSLARSQIAPVGNPSVSGYYAGGRSSAAVVTADKLTFSGETTSAATTANLSSSRAYPAGISERSTKGYYLGGSTSMGAPGAVTSETLTFSGDSASATASANLSAVRYSISGLTDGSTKGYVGGGQTGIGAYVATSDKITFSTDTTAASTASNLTTARQAYMSLSDGSTKGYWAGGHTGSAMTICDKVTFSTDVCSTQTSAALNQLGGGGCADGTNGYTIGGGFIPVGDCYKWTFSTDTNTALGSGSSLTVSRRALASISTVAL